MSYELKRTTPRPGSVNVEYEIIDKRLGRARGRVYVLFNSTYISFWGATHGSMVFVTGRLSESEITKVIDERFPELGVKKCPMQN